MTEETYNEASNLVGKLHKYREMAEFLGRSDSMKVELHTSDAVRVCQANNDLKACLRELFQSELDRLQKEFDAL